MLIGDAMFKSSLNVDGLDQVRHQGAIVQCVVGGDAKHGISNVEIGDRIEYVLGQILAIMCTLQCMEQEETIVKAELRINPMGCDSWLQLVDVVKV